MRLAKLLSQLMCNVVMALNAEHEESKLGVAGLNQTGGLKGRKMKLPQINSENQSENGGMKDGPTDAKMAKEETTNVAFSAGSVLDNIALLKGFVQQFYLSDETPADEQKELSEVLDRLEELTRKADEWRSALPSEPAPQSSFGKLPAAYKLLNRTDKPPKLNIIRKMNK